MGGRDLPFRIEARRLWYVPILHGTADLGTYAPKVAARRDAQAGERIADLWSQIRHEVLDLGLDYRRLRLYQDSMPCCGFESQIVADLARKGSANFLLLEDLMARGARIEGTESVELLMREMELVKHPERASAELMAQLLGQRDAFIAKRIDATLQEGEEGILFLGMLHDIASALPSSIALRYPLRIEP